MKKREGNDQGERKRKINIKRKERECEREREGEENRENNNKKNTTAFSTSYFLSEAILKKAQGIRTNRNGWRMNGET